MKKLNPHTFLDLPLEIGVAEAAKPELERYCREKQMTQEAAIQAMAQDHMIHIRTQIRIHKTRMDDSEGGIFVSDIQGYDLAVLDAMLPMVVQKRVALICQREQALDMSIQLMGVVQVEGFSGKVVDDGEPPLLH